MIDLIWEQVKTPPLFTYNEKKMKITKRESTCIHPGFAKVTVSDGMGEIEPPACFDEVYELWTEEEKCKFSDFIMRDVVARIESLGGFVSMPIGSPWIFPLD